MINQTFSEQWVGLWIRHSKRSHSIVMLLGAVGLIAMLASYGNWELWPVVLLVLAIGLLHWERWGARQVVERLEQRIHELEAGNDAV